ncbi:MAG TPA: hypothetical protein VGL66_04845 [Caulobacteraceae bacterium]|jgi:hypothetical protein
MTRLAQHLGLVSLATLASVAGATPTIRALNKLDVTYAFGAGPKREPGFDVGN